jgi:hypothetical protein
MEEKNYLYEATIKNEDNEIITKVFSYSQEGLLDEMKKGKWLNAVSVYEINEELEKDIDNEKINDSKDDIDRTSSDYENPLSEEEQEGDVKQP